MSIISWLFKSKREMAKPNTRPVKMGKYTITSHAQNRTVDPARSIKKVHVVQNLYGKAIQTKPYMYRGELNYARIHPKNKTATYITMQHRVKTIHRVHNPSKEIRKLGGSNRGTQKRR